MSQPTPVAAAPAKGKRRKGLIVLGLILFFGGIIAGAAIAYKGMSNYKDAVKSLARAPVGCTTTLVFDKPATFTIYTETKGTLGELGGDCEASSGDYEHSGDKLPKLSLTLEDPNGDPVDLQRGATAKYDVDGYVGTAVRTVRIEEAGTYHLNVESDETDFAVAIGKDPKGDNETLLLIGGGVLLGGFVLGLLLFLLGLRRRKLQPATADIRNPAGPLPGWPPAQYAGAAAPAPSGPPPPPVDPGFRQAPPPASQPIRLPEQPPIRLADQPPARGFAPPTLAPPAPPAPSDETPVTPPSAAPPTVSGPQTLPPPGSSWAKPEDSDDD